MLTHLDLFSGIGGFALAAKWAGFKTVAFCEIDPFCRKVLAKHWPGIFIFEDVRKMHFFQPIDVMTAGFPCQPFSVAGKMKGENDDRYLWPEVIRLAREVKPSWMVLENVPGIIPMLDPILEDLEREGYTWRAYLIPASGIGAPHKRERLWIVANCNSERCDKWTDNWEERYIQDDWQRHIEAIQSEWPQFQPESWSAFKAQDWLGFAADTDGNQCNQRAENNEPIAERSEWSKPTSEIVTHDTRFGWEKDKPPLPGVDDGLRGGVDRNKSLGNAIVPQVVFPMLALIAKIENSSRVL